MAERKAQGLSRFQKVVNCIRGGLAIIAAVYMCAWPEDGYLFVVAVIGLSMITSGVNKILFYITMARFMVGGKYILYMGIILLQFGFFTWSLDDVPKIYIMIYLIIINAFAGLIDILNARESLKYGSPAYKKELLKGVINLTMALLCIIFIKYMKAAVFIYSAGLFYSGAVRIQEVFEKKEMVYIK